MAHFQSASSCLALSRRKFLSTTVATGAVLASGIRPSRAMADKCPFTFYAMDTGLRGPDVPQLPDKINLLKRLGYAGIGWTLNRAELPKLLELLDAAGLELSAIYNSPFLEEVNAESFRDVVKQLKGRPTRLEFGLRSKSLKPSEPAGDKSAGEFLTALSDYCADTGPVVSIYPHTNFWTERAEDGFRLAQALNRPNVGTHFNLVHWKWVKQTREQEETLKEILPRLFCVTINGLADRKIVPLDEGDYDLGAFLQRLANVGYRGRVGLQGYSVPGNSAEHLDRSLKKWRELTAKLVTK